MTLCNFDKSLVEKSRIKLGLRSSFPDAYRLDISDDEAKNLYTFIGFYLQKDDEAKLERRIRELNQSPYRVKAFTFLESLYLGCVYAVLSFFVFNLARVFVGVPI